MSGWTPNQLPDLHGKTYVVTGGNSGLGLEASKILVGKGARVVFTSRSEAKANAAIDEVHRHVKDADVSFVRLDLADQGSVENAARELRDACPRIDALILNAGVMQPPETRTDEGWELQIATNHLGHFKLAALLFDLVEESGGRIVPVSSIAHKFGKIDLDDLTWQSRAYSATDAYGQSKLANIMFGLELSRRLSRRGSKVKSIPVHPGYSATNLQSAGVGMEGGSALFKYLYKVTNTLWAQSAEKGAYPLVLAAAWPDAKDGAYYGPTRLGDSIGKVGESAIAKPALDENVAEQLWTLTESLVGPFFKEEPQHAAA